MDRSDSDSLLSIVSQDLENALQNALEMAGAFVGMEAPKVAVSRDFDLQKLDGQQVAQYMSLWTNGAITHQTLLEILSRGEILNNVDVESEIEMIEQSKLAGLDLEAAGGVAPDDEEDEDADGGDQGEEQNSAVRAEVERRLRKLAEDDDEEDE